MKVFRFVFLFILFYSCLGMKLLANDFSQLVQASNDLGVKILKKKLALKEASSANITLAPFSLTTAVLSLALGSGGETRAELLSLLNSEEADGTGEALPQLDILWGDLGLLSKQIKAGNKGYTHDLGFFYDEQAPLLESYSDLMAKSFAVKCMPLLSLKSDAVVNQLNSWVKLQTKGKMVNLMHPAMLVPESTLYGIDIVMFQGEWLLPFSPENTKKASFYSSKGVAPKVGAFMNDELCQEFVIKDEFQLVWKGYKDSSVVMMIVLPVGKDTPESLLGKSSLAEWLRVRREREAVVNAKDFNAQMTDYASFFLPRFKIESPSEDLKSIFQDLGAKRCFDRFLADFSLMSRDRLHLNSFYQKNILQVGEKGTLAVGASVVSEAPFGGGKHKIRVNRPFFFLLVDQKTDLVLFMSLVRSPFSARERQ